MTNPAIHPDLAAEITKLIRISAAAQRLIDGGEPGDPYRNEHGVLVRDVCECDFVALVQALEGEANG